MASTTALYSPRVLALATSLADFPPRPDFTLHGQARSPACGSTLALDLDLDAQAAITGLGLSAHACAIGQAAAAIFARHAAGRNGDSIAATLSAMTVWLTSDAEIPDWPELDAIAAARNFPGRHGAILLPWKAALDALSSQANPR